MSEASALERQMLELINAERAANGLDPVQLELRLNASAEEHSDWMLEEDVFSHTGENGSSAGDRMEDSGFVFSGNWRWSENIAWQSERGDPGLEDDVIDLHNALMNSPGHRANILDPNVTVIGIGIELGEFNGYTAVMVTQNFARTSADLQLDTATSEPSEPTETEPPASETPEPETPEPTEPEETPDTTSATPTSGNDVITLDAPALIKLLAGNDLATGSSGNDSIYGNFGADTLNGGQGDDELFGGNHNDTLNGGSGSDTLNGQGGHDSLSGGSHADELNGNFGNDTLKGQNGTDTLNGGHGNDSLYGGNQNDVLNGGVGNDKLFGGNGNDALNGGAQADVLKGNVGNDTLDGGLGNDVLIGGLNKDTFVFSDGTDWVTDFGTGGVDDLIDLSAANGIDSYADLLANHAVEQANGHLRITDNDGDQLIVRNTDLSDLSASDFLF